jgi:hypothetical protein
MNKEFVPYELAVKLKELGFDEPCFAFYQIEYAEVIPTMVDDNEQYKLTGFRTCKNSEIPEHYTSAPTFSQAFRWFREKYQLHSTITSISQESWQWHIQKPGQQLGKLYDEDFYTYEEAELACLTKLIEIVENKSE